MDRARPTLLTFCPGPPIRADVIPNPRVFGGVRDLLFAFGSMSAVGATQFWRKLPNDEL